LLRVPLLVLKQCQRRLRKTPLATRQRHTFRDRIAFFNGLLPHVPFLSTAYGFAIAAPS